MNEEIKKQVISELGLEELDTMEQEAVMSDVGETILKQIFLDAYDKLPSDKQILLKTTTEGGDFEKTLEILEDSDIDFEELVKSASKNVIDSLK